MNDQQATSDQAAPSARGIVAAVLSFVTPGLGLVYVGRLMAGLVVNLLFVLFVLLFVIATTLLQFFPLYPAMILILVWLIMCALAAWRCIEVIDDGEVRRGRSFQHPLIYALVAVVTFAAPLAMTAHFTDRHLITVVSVDDPAMIPQAQPGDRLIVDRTVYRDRAPRRGDVVTVRVPGSDNLVTLRVAGLPTEQVATNGFILQIDNQLAQYSPLDSAAVNTAVLYEDASRELWVEHIDDQRYVITNLVGIPLDPLNSYHQLGDDEYFLLADNRSNVDDGGDATHVDSRDFGAVDAGHIEGRPLYVGWSTTQNAGEVRWERIGLPIH